MKKTRCPTCGRTTFQAASYAARRDLDGRRFTGDVPARKCTSCGELLISGPGLGAFERAITLELVRGGDVGPEGFRWLRKAAGLKAVRLAELLDVTPMQVSRWENGRKPLERRAVALVSALALEQVEGKSATRAVLEALAAGKKAPRSVRIDVAPVDAPRSS
jgi:DNA-binding transcriptional regulator YiaG